MIVDVHAHVVAREALRERAPGEAWRPSVRREQGVQVVELDGRAIRSAVDEMVDLDGILAVQAARGIERVVLSPWVPLLFGEAEPAEALERARIQNAGLAALVRARPDRVSALGAVPLQDAEAAAAELEALMAGGELAGVELPARVAGAYLGDDRFLPFWAAAERTGALVFIHPTTRGFGVAALDDYYLWNTVGNPLETTIAAAHMVMAGLLERHPGLRVVLAHGGGALPALRGRLRHAHSFQPHARARLQGSPEESLRRFFYDTVTHDAALLAELIAFAGAEHVLLGTDYPFDMADAAAVETVRACRLDADDEAAVLGGNAERLLGLAEVRA